MVGDHHQFKPTAKLYMDCLTLTILDEPSADEQVTGGFGSSDVSQSLFQLLRDFRAVHRKRSTSRCAHRTQLLIFEREFQFACREPDGSIAVILFYVTPCG
ncbi:hypothetical protein BJF93_20510 [Xaviernesmea oryzae]|uniref:Uncharacterized protein n=1 Tax=Xaviernesmea oryzae TaxID=464029 RepID=A0A1Q9AVY1_9HYPH|nr:hypothetical protein [Xaviernesmea oryzae]OLP59597.1 hypothetical protein BJF93_20510 [Xaviernesmea oryzae]SEM12568.1 hypothetical protein SAMN04487976_1208 [Xaviernesmea oryzae]